MKARNTLPQLIEALERQETALAQKSREYTQHLQVTGTRLEQIQARLPSGNALLEFRVYNPMDFTTGKLQEPHWLAALILPSTEEPPFVLKDLGPVQRTLNVWKQWQDERPQNTPEAVSDALYDILFRPFSAYLTHVQTVYIAPDGFLHLVPLEQLRVDGQYWIERQALPTAANRAGFGVRTLATAC